MAIFLKDILKDEQLTDDGCLSSAEVTAVKYYRELKRADITLKTETTFSFDNYIALKEALQKETGCAIRLFIAAARTAVTKNELRKYLSYIGKNLPETRILTDSLYIYEAGNSEISFLFNSPPESERAAVYLDDLKKELSLCGFSDIGLSCRISRLEPPVVETVMMPAEKPEDTVMKKSAKRQKTKYDHYRSVAIKDITQPVNDIRFEGTVFKTEEIEVRKTGKTIQQIYVYDGTGAVIVKRSANKNMSVHRLREIKESDMVRVYGYAEDDNYVRDLIVWGQEVEKLKTEKPVDNAGRKRVELHMHTNMSEMDGVCDAGDIVRYAFDIGHEGIVITDHADVQSFVKAYRAKTECCRRAKDRPFKIGLGCEMNMVNDALTVVRNPTDELIDEAEYVVFDLETTGLSCFYDAIIEFGAVKVKKQTIVDRKQMFIKPPLPIPSYISAKTNITDAMVKDAPTFAEAAEEITAWIGDAVLVAHNATFDYYFFNEELKRCGRPPLKNTVIDTLDLSRSLLTQRHAFRLGNVARYYHIDYDEAIAHRADYDAEVLENVFRCLLADARRNCGCTTIEDLQENTRNDTNFAKQRRSHICVLVKDKEGLKDLYQLVSETNTKTLAVLGKGSSETGDVAAEPKVLRSSLRERHEHLLFGSACLNGEVFELACNGDDKRLDEAMRFYDYIELQPLSCYSTFILTGGMPSVERLKLVQRRLIDHARRLNIPVVADSDAHYLRKDQKVFRDVYINAQGVGGVHHPLYIYDDELRRRTANPDQHLRLTEEMREEFSWLEDQDLINEIVIENPHRIFDQLEDVKPVPSGVFPPVIEGSDTKLRELCTDTAQKLYGYNGKLPETVEDRLSTELASIINNGFAVHYYIAHLLVEQSNKDGYVVGSRGSVGSSFTATMAGITEVNPLPPHYLCPSCHYSEWLKEGEVRSGFDLPDKPCPHCGKMMKGNGQNIPFQTFLGFNADKTPDIDLNFSNEYQAKAHAFIKQVFGEEHAFRAGTIGTVAEKTAYGYVTGYCEKMGIADMRRAMRDYLAHGCQNVKRTTGQHPGGIIIIPEDHDAEDFTPVQYPANDPASSWKTTHYDFHDIHDNVLKFDLLGHVDPTAMRLMQNIAVKKPMNIPMNDPETLSLFSRDDALRADPRIYKRATGALGIPEFGTRTTRSVLEETKPSTFSDLVIISGLCHGTDVWSGNAQNLVREGHPLSEVIGCRDDIMTYLLGKKLEPIDAFKIMEDVRKGKGLRSDQEEKMREHNVPEWYIDSCRKIKYMFPKAHAVAYVMMALRIAWYKVHEPINFYIQFFTLRCDAYEIETMAKGIEAVRARMDDIAARRSDRMTLHPVTNRENALYDTLEVCEEMYARGYRISKLDMQRSRAAQFIVDPDDDKCIIPPFIVVDGLGINAANSVVKARKEAPFISKEDLLKRTQLSTTNLKKLEALGCLDMMQDSNQMSLF